ncbi:FliH/SctL family protein [Erythrobacter sp. JK5]|uniref:FliH/SctL family protein n=1 Tax=Erythrobacter sp. JK5 TaxID=2829500 RepID=UPI001BA58885|nr:FliH/SctL family protein [Erythrobacter sp. JK5]QUL36914.1 flagellar biosynthesis protein [Erythrobacter sp. JK5]
MANSSDWIAAARGDQRGLPGWLTALQEAEGFREAAPYASGLPSGGHGPLEQQSHVDEQPDAIARAFAEGEAAGRAAAEAEAAIEIGHQRELRLAFRALDQAALDSLASELADTVVALCGQVLQASALDCDGLLVRCQAAASRIGSAASHAALHLHPDDIALIGESALAGWQVRPDPALDRGALLFEGADGAVRDGPTEWRRAIAEAVRG